MPLAARARSVGEKRHLEIPPNLAYGDDGTGPIPGASPGRPCRAVQGVALPSHHSPLYGPLCGPLLQTLLFPFSSINSLPGAAGYGTAWRSCRPVWLQVLEE